MAEILKPEGGFLLNKALKRKERNEARARELEVIKPRLQELYQELSSYISDTYDKEHPPRQDYQRPNQNFPKRDLATMINEGAIERGRRNYQTEIQLSIVREGKEGVSVKLKQINDRDQAITVGIQDLPYTFRLTKEEGTVKSLATWNEQFNEMSNLGSPWSREMRSADVDNLSGFLGDLSSEVVVVNRVSRS